MLAIVTSHPIQYQAPLWRELAGDGSVPFEVWFLTPHAVAPSLDREFGQTFAWDLDLLSGYPHRFLDIEAGWRLDRFDGVRLKSTWTQLLRDSGVTALWIEGWRFRTLWAAVAAARALGIPVWLRGENNDLAPERLAKRLWKRIALRWYFARIDWFLCIGTANRRFYSRHGISADRMVAAPYCIDNARFSAASQTLRPTRPMIRGSWQVDPGAHCVLYCGKLIPKKRPQDLQAAVRRLGRVDGRPVHILWVGDGELRNSLSRAREGAETCSTFAGFLNQSQMPAAYVAADCVVLPSDYGETWGLVVNESLASGTPAIASNRCGCAEDLAAPQGPAHVFPCGDVDALASSIASVLRSPPSAERMQALIDTHAPRRTVETVIVLAHGTS
ncbi:MAG TPA: glycosyltransferase [Opitutaceae bacterium]|nr:glycosyltransferase [Opitutaceae bacterium]